MQCLLFDKNKSKEDSIIARGLSEEGEILDFSFPGIVKSRKRSAFYVAPGTVWSFKFHRSGAGRIFPRDSSLVISAFDENIQYKEMLLLYELLLPLKYLLPGISHPLLFHAFLAVITRWRSATENEKQELLNYSLLFFLKEMGYYHNYAECTECQSVLNKSDAFIPSEGAFCKSCMTGKTEFFSASIPFGWVSYYSTNFAISGKPDSNMFEFNSALYSNENFKKSHSYRTFLIESFLGLI